MKTYKPFLWAAKKLGYVEPIPITYWDKHVIDYACTPVLTGGIILLGDSITEGWNTTKFMKDAINYGIAGDISAGTLKMLPVALKAQPKRIIINIGTNDIGSAVKPEETFRNLRAIYTQIVEAGVELIVCAIRPINPRYDMVKNRMNTTICLYNESIKGICEALGCTFEPETYTCNLLGPVFGDGLNPFCTEDGIHLNRNGYMHEFEVLKKYLI
jgi:lysophospholipase L1-like esterase